MKGTRFRKLFCCLQQQDGAGQPAHSSRDNDQKTFFLVFQVFLLRKGAARKPGHRAVELVTLAEMGVSPIASNVGKVINVPPPARALIIPAARAERPRGGD